MTVHIIDDTWPYYIDGEVAYRDHQPLEANPYEKGTAEADAWAEGWLDEDARQVAREAARLHREARYE